MSPYDAQDVHSLTVENAKIMTHLDNLVGSVGELKDSVKELRTDLRTDRDSLVPRKEFDEYKTTRDREIREIKDTQKVNYTKLDTAINTVAASIEIDRRAKHIPLPMTITTVVGVGGFIVLLIEKIAT